MKKLLFLCLFLLLKNGVITAQGHRLSVDLLSPGVSSITNNNNDNKVSYWFSLTYESKRKNSKTWGIRASLLQRKNIREYTLKQETDLSQQIKLIFFNKKYVDNKYWGRSFWGYYGALSHLEEGRYTTFLSGHTYSDLERGVHIGGGVLLGANFYITEHILMEFIGGIGIGGTLNSSFYDEGMLSGLVNSVILFSPSFLDINLCYEF